MFEKFWAILYNRLLRVIKIVDGVTWLYLPNYVHKSKHLFGIVARGLVSYTIGLGFDLRSRELWLVASFSSEKLEWNYG